MATSRATRLPPDPASIPAARHFALEALAELGAGHRDEVELLVSELATNAVLHAGTPLLVALSRRGDLLRVEVGDADTTEPEVNLHPDPLRPGGRGLCLVDLIADKWGIDLTDDGKTIWFELGS